MATPSRALAAGDVRASERLPEQARRLGLGRSTGGEGLRVAYVMSRFPKITETFVLYEMSALEAQGARVEVFPLRREPDGPRHPEAAVYEARAHFAPVVSWRILCANWKRLVRDPRSYLRTYWHALSGTWGSPHFFLGALAHLPKCVLFAEEMERLGIDHVHAHFATHPALAALVIHRLTGIPFSFTAHGSDLHVDRTMLAEKVKEASFVVAVSGYNRDLILEEAGSEHGDKVVVIHCGADPGVFGTPSGPAAGESAAAGLTGTGAANGSVEAREPRVPSERPAISVACVASLEEVKGHRFLLDSCRLLVDRGVDVRCDLAGGGQLRERLQRRVEELGLQDRVRLHGPVPRPEVRRILAEADVAVLASYPTESGRREGIPVALMEAMMSGLPVVASGLSGIPELVSHGETGYLVAPGDPWSLADRLADLAAAPDLRRRMGAAGRCKVLTEFDLTRTARLLLQEIAGRATASRDRRSSDATVVPPASREAGPAARKVMSARR